MSENNFLPTESFESKKARIKVIGVGGGGGNAINHMVRSKLKDVDFIAVNTDAQDLRRNLAPIRAQIGEELTQGLGVGGDPVKGRKAAEESYEILKCYVNPCDLLFITAGMGGGTGTGAAPYIAKIAKEMLGDEILVIGVVTRPFSSEGYRREQLADEGIREMQKYVDSMIIIPNEKLFSNINNRTSNREAFEMVDEVLLQAVRGISDVITQSGVMNIDFNDVRKIMSHSGKSLIGIGEASGPGRHLAAVKQAISSPLLENADISGAKGFLVHCSVSEMTFVEHGEVMDFIRQYASNDSMIKFGHSYDPSMEDKLRITVIASGFDERKASAFSARRARPIGAEGTAKARREEKYNVFQEKKNFEDPLLVPACMRRKKRV